MSIFDDESDKIKKVEVCVLIPMIRKTLDFIQLWMQRYPEYVCIDTDITSILKKNGYEVTYEQLGDYATIMDRWYYFLDSVIDSPLQKIDENYNLSLTTERDQKYLSITLKFSKVEIIINDGYPYISAVGNNILLMEHYPDGGIPDFIKFFGKPTIVLMDNNIPDDIGEFRDDCIFIKYQEGYNLDNIIEEKVISIDEYYKNSPSQYCVDSMLGFLNNGEKFTLKIDYDSTLQDIYSG